MKKTFFIISLLIFLNIFFVFQVWAVSLPATPPAVAPSPPSIPNINSSGPVFQRLSLEIKDLKLNKETASYQTGEKIEGSFKLKNITNFFAQGIYYEIAIHRQNLDPKTSPVFFLNQNTLYDRVRITEPISFSPQEEKQINFSYQISKYFPAGNNYYLQIAVFSSREDILVNDFVKITVDNPAKTEKFTLFDYQKSQVFGKDKMWALQQGAVFDYDAEYQPVKLGTSTLPLLPKQSKKITIKPIEPLQVPEELKPAEVLENQVKVSIFGRVVGEEIQKPNLKIVSYRYGAPLKEVFNRSVQWESSFAKNSSSSFEIVLPLFKDPGAYETFIQFFDGEEKVSNPLGIRYITAGDSGLIYDFLVEQKSAGNFVLNVLFTAPADTYVRDLTKDIPAQLIFTAKEEKTGKVCLSKTIDVNLKDSKPVQEPFILEDCSSPLVFGAQLKKDGQVLDEQKTIVQVFQPKPEKNYLAVIIGVIVLTLAGLGFLLFKKFKKEKLPPSVGLFIIIFIVSLTGIFGADYAKADTPPAMSCGYSYCYTCDSGANNSWCYYDWWGYECAGCYECGYVCLQGHWEWDLWVCDQLVYQCNPSSQTCGSTCEYFPRTDPFSWWGRCDFLQYGYEYSVSGYCIGRNKLYYQWAWSNGVWSQFKFNDAYDSDASPNRFLYGFSTWFYGLWWYPLDYTISYPYDVVNGYFNVPSSDSYISWYSAFHAAPNCHNDGGIGQGSMTAFILDSNGNVVKQLSTPPNWAITYQEGEAGYWFNLPLSGLTPNQKYTLKIQDYKLFYGGQRTADYMNFAYVSADFCYGDCGPKTLSVSKSGTGSGTVTSNPAGINCGSDCTENYSSGTSVTLTASTASGSTFAGWSGDADCSDGTVTMDASKTCTATFNPSPFSTTLTAAPSSGTAPLNNVVLTADVSGSAVGTINYTFYCDRFDAGTNITAGWAYKLDGTNDDPLSAPAGVCDSVYSSIGSYSAKVIVERGGLAAEARQTVTVNAPLPPNAPSNLTASAVSCSQINLTWQDNSNNEDGFKIERKTGTGGTYAQIDAVGPNIITYSNYGLSENTTYYYRVRAYNTYGDSDYSNDASAITPSCPAIPTLAIVPSSASIKIGDSIQMTALYDPDGPAGPQSEQNVTNTSNWSSDNPAIATVDNGAQKGLVTGITPGPTTIRAGYSSLEATASISVSLRPWWKEVIPW